MFQILCGVALLASVCSGCNQARRDSTWFTDRVPTDTKDFQADAPGLQCWQCDGSFVKHERRTCLRIGERKQNCDGSVQYCELRLRVGYRNYIHADRGDMPAERQVTWRGCARDWITEGDPYQNDQGYQTDPSYPPGMKCKRTGILRSEEIAPGEEELHCLCPDSLCNEHVVVFGSWGEYTYSASIVLGCFAALLVLLVAVCFICGIAN